MVEMFFQMKKYSGRLLQPLGEKLQHIPANYFTILSCMISLVTGIAFYFNILPIVVICLFFIEFFDQLDGVVARIQGSTIFGAFLDSTLDRYGDLAIYIGILFGNYGPSWIIIGALVGALMTSYTRARFEGLSNISLGGIGLLERTDRIPLLLIGAFFQIWFDAAIAITMIVLLIGSNITAIQRIIFAYRNLNRKHT